MEAPDGLVLEVEILDGGVGAVGEEDETRAVGAGVDEFQRRRIVRTAWHMGKSFGVAGVQDNLKRSAIFTRARVFGDVG